MTDRIIGLYAMENSTREISDWMEENLDNRVLTDIFNRYFIVFFSNIPYICVRDVSLYFFSRSQDDDMISMIFLVSSCSINLI